MGHWGADDNWSPAAVPNNCGIMSYNVSIMDHVVSLDIDPTISILQLGGEAATITSVDHSITSAATSVTSTGTLDFTADAAYVTFDAGALSDFIGQTLTGGKHSRLRIFTRVRCWLLLAREVILLSFGARIIRKAWPWWSSIS